MHHGVTSIKQRLELIAQRIDLSVREPQKSINGQQYMLKDFTHEIIRGTRQTGPASESEPMEACFRFVRYGLENREDPADYDYYMSAGRAINSGAGDCDDKVILLNAMLSSIGYTTGARVCSPDGGGWHIYTIIGVNPAFNGMPSGVIAMDPRYGDEVGWEPADKYRRFERECTFNKGRVVGYKSIRNGGGLFSFLQAAGLPGM